MLNPQTPEDESGLLSLQKKDESAFMEALFKKYYTPLGRTVNRMVNDPQATEDILQDVFLKLWHNRKGMEFTYSIKSYLYRAAINAALNYLEKNFYLEGRCSICDVRFAMSNVGIYGIRPFQCSI